MTPASDIGRKHPAHPPIIERRYEPVIIHLTVCSKDRKSIFAFADSAAVIVYAWQKASLWLVGRYVTMRDHVHLFCGAQHVSYDAAEAMGEILEESCLLALAGTQGSSHL